MKKRHQKIQQMDILNQIDATHCTEYLDLYVISEDVELKIKAVCLSSEFPFVIEPDSTAHVVWNNIHLIALLLMSILFPYWAAFSRRIPDFLLIICCILNIITSFDVIGIQMFTAIRMKGRMIANPLDIILYNCKQPSFLVDIFGTLPLGSVCYYGVTSEHIATLFMLTPLVKVRYFQKKIIN